MIPERKKSHEEIAALREGLGIQVPAEEPKRNLAPAPPLSPATPQPAPLSSPPDPVSPVTDVLPQSDENIIHLNITPLPPKQFTTTSHSLRKHDLPLAPASPVTHQTTLPSHRHDFRDIAQIRKREALAKLQQPGVDPVAHIRKQTAHPLLYLPGYLLAIATGVTIYQRFHYITPIVLLALSLAITLYIAIRKPRSRHHAALIFILIFLTAAFGGLHYAPHFRNVP